MDQQSQTKRQTDGQTDMCRQQQYHFSLIGPRGKNWLGNVWELICWECLSAGLKARSSSPQWVSWKQPISAVELTPSPSPRHLPLLTPLSISKCGMQLPIHSQTSVVALLKFGNGYITSNSHKCQRPQQHFEKQQGIRTARQRCYMMFYTPTPWHFDISVIHAQGFHRVKFVIPLVLYIYIYIYISAILLYNRQSFFLRGSSDLWANICFVQAAPHLVKKLIVKQDYCISHFIMDVYNYKITYPCWDQIFNPF